MIHEANVMIFKLKIIIVKGIAAESKGKCSTVQTTRKVSHRMGLQIVFA